MILRCATISLKASRIMKGQLLPIICDTPVALYGFVIKLDPGMSSRIKRAHFFKTFNTRRRMKLGQWRLKRYACWEWLLQGMQLLALKRFIYLHCIIILMGEKWHRLHHTARVAYRRILLSDGMSRILWCCAAWIKITLAWLLLYIMNKFLIRFVSTLLVLVICISRGNERSKCIVSWSTCDRRALRTFLTRKRFFDMELGHSELIQRSLNCPTEKCLLTIVKSFAYMFHVCLANCLIFKYLTWPLRRHFSEIMSNNEATLLCSHAHPIHYFIHQP